MKSLSKFTWLAVVLLSGSAVPTFASTIALGTLGTSSTPISEKVSGTTLLDYYTFSTLGPASITAILSSTNANANQLISNFNISLYSGSTAGFGTFLSSAITTQFPKFEYAVLAADEAAGSYYLQVTGSSNGVGIPKDTPSYGGNLALSVSAVPLPASLPMFAAALLGFAGVSYGMKRKARDRRGEPGTVAA